MNSKQSQSIELLILGTVHRDPEGASRLQRVLQLWAPDAITVEVSRFALDYRRRQGARFQRRLQQAAEKLTPSEFTTGQINQGILAIHRFLDIPFEYQAASEMADPEIEVEPIDLSTISREHLPRSCRELTTVSSLREAVRQEPMNCPAAYRRAHSVIASPSMTEPFLLKLREHAQWRRRERTLASRIRRAGRRLGGGRLLHIGGWEHLIEDHAGRTLYCQLRDDMPLRLLLGDIDRLPMNSSFDRFRALFLE